MLVYRIVAQPIGDTSTRLAAIEPIRKLGEKPLVGATGAAYLKRIAAKGAGQRIPAIPAGFSRALTGIR